MPASKTLRLGIASARATRSAGVAWSLPPCDDKGIVGVH